MQWIERKSEMNQGVPAVGMGTEMAWAHETILLVEDEKFVRDVTGEILQSAGYRVLKARDAADAMLTFRRYRDEVQLLLTDVVMPGQSGRSLADDLKAMSLGLRTIFISGYPENSVTRNGFRQPGVFFLPKPFSAQSLLRQVKQALAITLSTIEGSLRVAGSG
jgi:two-component system, cell cycle sensor histidine kinase and response regulator CckA